MMSFISLSRSPVMFFMTTIELAFSFRTRLKGNAEIYAELGLGPEVLARLAAQGVI